MRVFLSYSRADLAHAEPIEANLKQAGHEVFFDRHSLKAAEDYNRIIWSEIQEAELFVVLISPSSVRAGSYVLTELALAEKKWPNPAERVLPVVIESTDFAEIPIYASICQMLQPEGNVAAEVRVEVDALHKRLGRKKLARAAAVFAGVAVLGLLAVFGYREYLDQRPVSARETLAAMNVSFDAPAFIDSAFEGDLDAIDLFLTAGMDPNAINDEGATALMGAVAGDHFEVLSALIEAKADVNVEDSTGSTALTWAARGGSEAIVAMLLEAGADTHTDALSTAFVDAARNGHSAVLQMLLPREISQPAIDEAFAVAAGSGHRAILQLLLDKISDRSRVASVALMTAARQSRYGPVQIAPEQLQTFEFLFDLDAAVDFKSNDGSTPLIWAIRNKVLELAKLLLEKGADSNTRCECGGLYDGGWTPLTLAVDRYSTGDTASLVDLLLTNGAEVNLAKQDGRTPLMLAAERGDPELVRTLLEKGASVNDQSEKGKTALDFAAAYRHGDVVSLLLNSGADVHASSNAWFAAVINDDHRVVELLLAKKVDVNERDGEGRTALMRAAQQGAADMVRVLLAAGARVAEKDTVGRTAEVFAKRGESAEIIELLQQAAK